MQEQDLSRPRREESTIACFEIELHASLGKETYHSIRPGFLGIARLFFAAFLNNI